MTPKSMNNYMHAGNNSESTYTIICGNGTKSFCKDFLYQKVYLFENIAPTSCAYFKIKQFNLSFACQDINLKLFIYRYKYIYILGYIISLFMQPRYVYNYIYICIYIKVFKVYRQYSNHILNMGTRIFCKILLLLLLL